MNPIRPYLQLKVNIFSIFQSDRKPGLSEWSNEREMRKTFICKALSLNIPPNVVMKWTRHSDYKAMKPYIDIADSIKVNSMALFDL